MKNKTKIINIPLGNMDIEDLTGFVEVSEDKEYNNFYEVYGILDDAKELASNCTGYVLVKNTDGLLTDDNNKPLSKEDIQKMIDKNVQEILSKIEEVKRRLK